MDQNNHTAADCLPKDRSAASEDAGPPLYLHRIEIRPDDSGRKRPVLIVDFAPAPR